MLSSGEDWSIGGSQNTTSHLQFSRRKNSESLREDKSVALKGVQELGSQNQGDVDKQMSKVDSNISQYCKKESFYT